MDVSPTQPSRLIVSGLVPIYGVRHVEEQENRRPDELHTLASTELCMQKVKREIRWG